MLRALELCSLFQSYDPNLLMSHINYRTDLFLRPLDKVNSLDTFEAIVDDQLFLTDLL